MALDAQRDFFISYNRADRTWAEWIAWQLEAEGFTVFLQAWDILPGENFVLRMHKEGDAKRTIVVLSPDFLASQYTAAEWADAFADDPSGIARRLIPIKARPCEPEGLLGQIVYVDFVGLSQNECREALLTAVRESRAKPSVAPGFPGSASQPVQAEPEFPGTVETTKPAQSSPTLDEEEAATTPLTSPRSPTLIEPAPAPSDHGSPRESGKGGGNRRPFFLVGGLVALASAVMLAVFFLQPDDSWTFAGQLTKPGNGDVQLSLTEQDMEGSTTCVVLRQDNQEHSYSACDNAFPDSNPALGVIEISGISPGSYIGSTISTLQCPPGPSHFELSPDSDGLSEEEKRTRTFDPPTGLKFACMG
jgi:hypothetical protein